MADQRGGAMAAAREEMELRVWGLSLEFRVGGGENKRIWGFLNV